MLFRRLFIVGFLGFPLLFGMKWTKEYKSDLLEDFYMCFMPEPIPGSGKEKHMVKALDKVLKKYIITEFPFYLPDFSSNSFDASTGMFYFEYSAEEIFRMNSRTVSRFPLTQDIVHLHLYACDFNKVSKILGKYFSMVVLDNVDSTLKDRILRVARSNFAMYLEDVYGENTFHCEDCEDCCDERTGRCFSCDRQFFQLPPDAVIVDNFSGRMFKGNASAEQLKILSSSVDGFIDLKPTKPMAQAIVESEIDDATFDRISEMLKVSSASSIDDEF